MHVASAGLFLDHWPGQLTAATAPSPPLPFSRRSVAACIEASAGGGKKVAGQPRPRGQSQVRVLVAASLTMWDRALPQSLGGWTVFVGVAATSTLSTLLIYLSTDTVGPFRTALAMNLEPLVTLFASVALLHEVLKPVQMLGAGAMIAALWVFQFVHGR